MVIRKELTSNSKWVITFMCMLNLKEVPLHAEAMQNWHLDTLGPFIYQKELDYMSVTLCCDLKQVEPNKELLVEPLCILDQRETVLQKRAIIQVQVQWRHFSMKEATLEDKEFMHEAYLELFQGKNQKINIKDGVLFERWGDVTPLDDCGYYYFFG